MIKRYAGRAFLLASAIASASLVGMVHADAQPAGAAAAPAAAATAVPLNPEHPTTYTVKPGDTLWGISEKFLKNPWQWPEVWHINEQVGNPHQIYPGDVLRLVWNDGKPSLVADHAGIGSENSTIEVIDANTVKLKPRIREMPVAVAIPAIPLKNIEAFLTNSRVVTQEEIKAAPYIVAGDDKRIIMGGGDTVYARKPGGTWSDVYPEFGVFRAGTPYIDPVTNEFLGYEAKRIGGARIVDSNADIATMRVLESSEDLRIDDRMLYDDQRKIQSIFYPKPSPKGVEGQIISVFGALDNAARNDVVVINKGLRDKIETGHVFAIMRKGDVVRDRNRGDIVSLPPTRSGLLIVFRTFDKVSYGLVTRSTRPVSKGDIVNAPRIDLE